MNTNGYLLSVILASLWFLPAWGGAETSSRESDLARLQGRWTARAGARRAVQVALEFKGSQVKATVKTPQGLRLVFTGEVKLDPAASPRRLDWINFTGADQQEFPALLGIYKLEGDRFTVCNGGLNASRPSEFKPGDGILGEVVVFERERATADIKSKATRTASVPVKK